MKPMTEKERCFRFGIQRRHSKYGKVDENKEIRFGEGTKDLEKGEGLRGGRRITRSRKEWEGEC